MKLRYAFLSTGNLRLSQNRMTSCLSFYFSICLQLARYFCICIFGRKAVASHWQEINKQEEEEFEMNCLQRTFSYFHTDLFKKTQNYSNLVTSSKHWALDIGNWFYLSWRGGICSAQWPVSDWGGSPHGQSHRPGGSPLQPILGRGPPVANLMHPCAPPMCHHWL